MPLLHHTELHQHDDPLPLCDDQVATIEEGSAPPNADHPV